MGNYSVRWERQALKDYQLWKGQNPKVAAKIDSLVNSILEDGPVKGIGKPEVLLNRKDCTRRISDWHRLIYRLDNNVVTILSCYGHTKNGNYGYMPGVKRQYLSKEVGI